MKKTLFGAMIGACSLLLIPEADALPLPHAQENIHKLTFSCTVDAENLKGKLSLFQGQEGHGSVLFEGRHVTALGVNAVVRTRANVLLVSSMAADFLIDLDSERKEHDSNNPLFSVSVYDGLIIGGGKESLRCEKAR